MRQRGNQFACLALIALLATGCPETRPSKSTVQDTWTPKTAGDTRTDDTTADTGIDTSPSDAGDARPSKDTVSDTNTSPDMSTDPSSNQCPQVEVVGRAAGSTEPWSDDLAVKTPKYVLLDASRSTDPDGRIVRYDWRAIERPSGASVNFEPWPGDSEDERPAKRRLRIHEAGEYKIRVRAIDDEGRSSCGGATVRITAEERFKLQVEVTWTNPEDPDETDDHGSDLDLHVVKMGPGKWFEAPYDIYFRNPNQNRGSGDSIWGPEDPTLILDDTNGQGPELFGMDKPADCQWYAVGVHYYKELYGTAYATVRITIDGKTIFEKRQQPLKDGGVFWDVARIHTKSNRVIGVGTTKPGGGFIKTKPAVTSAMKKTELCTSNDLY